MLEQNQTPRPLILLISLIQGLLLWALTETMDNKTWLAEQPLLLYPFWTLSIVMPFFLLLSVNRVLHRNFLPTMIGSALILTLVGIYAGWQATPYGEFPLSNMSLLYVLSIGIGCFKALIYIQVRSNNLPMTYQTLFTHSWRNFLIPAFSGVFVLVFGLLLLLWAKLFSLIQVTFFETLFSKTWFFIPALSLAFGVGVIIFRELIQVIDSITTLLQGLIKLLLPVALLLAVLFMLTLPFAGLGALWDTGVGTGLLLWLTALILFFVNAVYQDGRISPYPSSLHRLVYIGVCVLPFLCALSFYGLMLRLNDYGWTVQRCWAMMIWLVLTLFSLGYVWGIIRKQAQWPLVLAKVNSGMGLLVLFLMIASNSPLLNFRTISVDSQLSRVEAENFETLDISYIRQHLARPGYLALDEIKQQYRETKPDLVRKIDGPIHQLRNLEQQSTEQFWQQLTYRPSRFDVPAPITTLVDQQNRTQGQYHFAGGRNSSDHTDIMIQIDLNDDTNPEYALIRLYDRGDGRYEIQSANYFYQDNFDPSNFDSSNSNQNNPNHKNTLKEKPNWKMGNFHSSYGRQNMISAFATNSINGPNTAKSKQINTEQSFRSGKIELVNPEFKNLKIGDIILKPM